ncbi:formate dehydrogenase accessory sulfurtransferase FdhD [Fulvivirga ligni]|uniref:formate dehydrogenase accessory sulfurtransferase FdhD n=1 Tax=Fulvivirga ligni TaxID=2904246 RepID=UPI001F15EDCA|nr:formate dehydrogenase accessory sulfurtransferase FdhD [Fulvivirga ligni]UII23645.1 formate dehydrogenase accessory sulfurtransferase FdhD [Fulvivirga ligni]
MSNTRVGATEIIKNYKGDYTSRPDLLATEEPLEIRVGFGEEHNRREEKLAVTMRTPGNDAELAMGFLFTEGIITNAEQVVSALHCENVKPEEKGNVIRVELHPEHNFDPAILQRNFYTNSSCGVCGKSSIESIHQLCNYIDTDLVIEESYIRSAPEKLRAGQDVFEHTGGLHAAGLFDKLGQLCFIREDVGRHNAMDKLVGTALSNSLLPLSEYFILVSGRASFELVQKGAMAGTALMAAVGAPSSLAVNLAKETGMTLVGFLKMDGFNIYSGIERINLQADNYLKV